MLVVSGLGWARRHKRKFDAVLTIEDPCFVGRALGQFASLRFHRQPAPAHLILRFYDLDYPLPEPYHQSWMRLATQEDIVAALAFAQQHESLLIHCKAGVARSAAVALAILTERLHDPQMALDALLEIRPIAVPNRCVVALADDLLGYHGRLLSTLDAWDNSIRSNGTRRLLCRVAHFYEFGVPLEVEFAAPLLSQLL